MGQDFEKMQNEVPNYLKLDSNFEIKGGARGHLSQSKQKEPKTEEKVVLVDHPVSAPEEVKADG